MKDSIRLHPKHGLNPTMAVCHLCGEDTGEIALLGAAYKGEAPSKMVISDIPCDKCKKFMEQGIMFISVRDGETDYKNPYRTGRIFVVKEDIIEDIIQNEDMKKDILTKRACFVEDEVLKRLGIWDATTPIKD